MKLGIIVSQLYGNESLFYFLRHKNVVGFYINHSRPMINLNVPLFNISEIHGFNGDLMCTNWETFQAMRNATTTHRKIVYVSELEWMKNQDFYENIQCNYPKEYEYISNGEYVQTWLKRSWGINSNIIREVELEKLWT